MSGKLLNGKRLKRASGAFGQVHPESSAGISEKAPPVLITGGSGFIGTNLAHRLLLDGHSVTIFDNFSRPGVEQNAEWLRDLHGARVRIVSKDIRDRALVAREVRRASQVFHFAAQVAVTTSLVDPIFDFEVNVLGTLNVLEALRDMNDPPPLVFTSTNKVYGGLGDIKLKRNGTRYHPADSSRRGISERYPLDFHSPYGCSKGAADQYVVDYARTFGVRAVVLRMSCIYGPHQFGTEDQGWIAHFLIRAMDDQPITLFGDGRQVRDALFVDDLVEAMTIAQREMASISGQAFNIGGGPDNTISLIELLDIIEGLHGRKPAVERMDWRPGDQRYYVSDIDKFREATGWRPGTGVEEGVSRLYEWFLESRSARRRINTDMRLTLDQMQALT